MISLIAILNRLDSNELENARTGFNLQGFLGWLLLLATIFPMIICFGIVIVTLCWKCVSLVIYMETIRPFS